MSIHNIYNYKPVDQRIATAGQPTAEQLQHIAAEGFEVVLNLATFNPKYSLENEEALVRSLGMEYYHLPVEWENPTEDDFQKFVGIIKRLDRQKLLIHCIANYRVSAFFALYARKQLGWTDAQADDFIARIWQPSEYPVWADFITQMRS